MGKQTASSPSASAAPMSNTPQTGTSSGSGGKMGSSGSHPAMMLLNRQRLLGNPNADAVPGQANMSKFK